MKSLNEFLIETFSNTKLFEMAYSRKDYITKVNNLSGQLVENWCLCKYCTLYDKSNINHKHWQKELHSVIDDLNKMFVKVDKKKATEYALIANDELNNTSHVKRYVKRKFDNEHIICSDLLAKSFVNELSTVINMICISDYDMMTTYCYNV